jgi:hypothetical protein
MQADTVQNILDKIEDQSFLAPTSIASGYDTVADVIGQTPEIETLLANADASLPLIRERYRQDDASMAEATRLVYFVIFGLARDREMLPDIVARLKQYERLSTATLIWPWHPYLHGVKALESITGGHVQTPGTGGSAKQFRKFLDEVERWAAANPKQ